MNEMQIFNNPEFGKLRTLIIDGEPWVVGKDVATALKYGNTSKAVRDHVDDEDKRMAERNVPPYVTDDLGRRLSPVLINESGLYSLIMSSKLPSAKKFKRWVTSEVLPSIRKTGSYTAPATTDEPKDEQNDEAITPGQELTPTDYLNAARSIAMCRRDQMPYVISLLREAGFDISELEKPLKEWAQADKKKEQLALYTVEERVECAREAREALGKLKDMGLTYADIGRVIGLNRSLVHRYYNQMGRPSPRQAGKIIAAVNEYIAN